jgi:predicted PolB exonuclease-like 3'-5' exonuclease
MEKRDGFEKQHADERIILKLAFRKQDEELGTRFVRFRIDEPVVGCCTQGNDPWSVIKYSEFLD